MSAMSKTNSFMMEGGVWSMKSEREFIESLESFPKVDCVDSDVYRVITTVHPWMKKLIVERGT